jgi:signal transduction histidine kinase
MLSPIQSPKTGGHSNLLPDISLRLRIVLFFCVLGLLPQMAISYLSVDAYTRSLEETYDKQVSQLVAQAAEQTSTQVRHLINDLENQATQPYLQLIFQEYPQNTRLRLLQERLELFRTSRGTYNRLNLCYLNGERLASSTTADDTAKYLAFERSAIAGIDPDMGRISSRIYPEGNELAIFVPVHSFRQSNRVVGFMVAYLPLDTLTLFLEKLELGDNVRKSILDEKEQPVKTFNPNDPSDAFSRMLNYSASVQPLNWRIVIDISEEELFRDVVSLKRKITLIIGTIIVLVFVASIVFNHRFTRPFKKIISGTRTFAKGNLAHRITVKSGLEAKQLAAAFNEMADQLNDRQMQLNQAVRLAALGVMTAGIGHEIKNPLTGIKTSSQVINRILAADGSLTDDNHLAPDIAEDFREVAELAKGISDEADRLTKILNDLLKFGRPRKPRIKPFNLADAVKQAVNLMRPEYDKRKVKLVTQVAPHEVLADSEQILQVLLNLLLNGLQAVDCLSGQVEIVTKRDTDQNTLLMVTDNGKGIPEDKLEHIFDPFFSLREDGTGLGLSVVYTLLQQNHASLKVTSGVARGTQCTITFEAGPSPDEEMANDGNCNR